MTPDTLVIAPVEHNGGNVFSLVSPCRLTHWSRLWYIYGISIYGIACHVLLLHKHAIKRDSLKSEANIANYLSQMITEKENICP